MEGQAWNWLIYYIGLMPFSFSLLLLCIKMFFYDQKTIKAHSFPLSLFHYQDIDDDEVVKGGAGIWLVLPEAGDDSNFGCSPLGEGRLCEHPCISPF